MALDDKLDRVLEHILEIRETLAEMKGERLPARVAALEEKSESDGLRWAKMTGAAALAGAIIAGAARKLGF